MDPQFTDRLTQEKCQMNTTSSSTGKIKQCHSSHFTRSGDTWLARSDEQKEDTLRLKAEVGDEPTQPPATGWEYMDWEADDWEEDESLKCTIPVSSPPCCLTVTLTGPAKEAQGKCEGTYKPTGLISSGRKVKVA